MKESNENNSNKVENEPKPKPKRHFSRKFKVTTIPQDFYKKIIELENKIQLSQRPNMEDVRELGALYKKGIEAFCSTSSRKVNFYSNKLTKLLIGADKLAKKQKKKPSKWSVYMNSHKKNYNKFMLFLQIESSNQEAKQIIDTYNKRFGVIYNELCNNLDSQKNNFRERLKLKKMKKNTNEINENNIVNNDEQSLNKINIEKENININSIINKFKGRNDLVDISLKDFLKKFHYIYLRTKIFEEPIESFNYILDDMFCHKVAKYYYYQDQIKEFELMLGDQDRGDHDDSLAFFMIDLQNERKTYYLTLETFIENIKKKIQTRCSGAHISKDKYLVKYLQEFMSNISKIFI